MSVTKPRQSQRGYLFSHSFWLLAASVRPQLVFAFPRTLNKWPLWGFPGMGTSLLVDILGASCSHTSTCLWTEAVLLCGLPGGTRQACFPRGPLGGQEGQAPFWIDCQCLCQRPSYTHSSAGCNRVRNDSVLTNLLCR